ncbi:hypothetical protein K438DRAFT_1759162 [Mycena galopus ATCC 62051]|nr:hypothetical protein K438DRAFT_1759162 [Mycena galopus ATCC 62051]
MDKSAIQAHQCDSVTPTPTILVYTLHKAWLGGHPAVFKQSARAEIVKRVEPHRFRTSGRRKPSAGPEPRRGDLGAKRIGIEAEGGRQDARRLSSTYTGRPEATALSACSPLTLGVFSHLAFDSLEDKVAGPAPPRYRPSLSPLPTRTRPR